SGFIGQSQRCCSLASCAQCSGAVLLRTEMRIAEIVGSEWLDSCKRLRSIPLRAALGASSDTEYIVLARRSIATAGFRYWADSVLNLTKAPGMARMRSGLVMLTALLLLSGSVAVAQPAPCAVDVKKLCAGIRPGEG